MSQDTTSALAAAPTAKDGLFFLSILMNMNNKPEVDWNLVAQEAGFKNAKVASTRFGQMKKKFIPNGSTASGSPLQSPNASFSSTATVPNTPKTPTGSPSKRVKKEVGSGTNVSSSGVRKTPGKGSALNRGSNSKAVRKRLDDSEESDRVFARSNTMFGVKYEDDEDDDFMPGY